MGDRNRNFHVELLILSENVLNSSLAFVRGGSNFCLTPIISYTLYRTVPGNNFICYFSVVFREAVSLSIKTSPVNWQ